MMVRVHFDVKHLFNGPRIGRHIHQSTIRISPGHRQPLGLCEIDDRIIIRRCWTELFREFLRRKIMVIVGAGRILELL